MKDPAAFIRANTELLRPPLVPEIVLHLATEIVPIWRKTEEELLNGLDKDKLLIDLEHEPRNLETVAKSGFDLDLAGTRRAGRSSSRGVANSIVLSAVGPWRCSRVRGWKSWHS